MLPILTMIKIKNKKGDVPFILILFIIAIIFLAFMILASTGIFKNFFTSIGIVQGDKYVKPCITTTQVTTGYSKEELKTTGMDAVVDCVIG